MLEPLTKKQAAHLKGLAQRLDAQSHIGKQGVTDPFLDGLRAVLNHHELVKVRFAGHKEERRELAAQVAAAMGAAVVTVIGNVAVLYRPHPNPALRKITLPPPAEGEGI